MKIYCTRKNCSAPENFFDDLEYHTLKTVQQKYCLHCGMPLILDGRYLPTHLLAKGGFGTAFLAIDRRTPSLRSCVVKQLQPDGNLKTGQVSIAHKLFIREGEVLERLGFHPQIPTLYAFFDLDVSNNETGKNDHFFYLVQEFITGVNLEDEFNKRGQFREQEIMDILKSILPVIKFIHDHDAIHRDIKPSNIMRGDNGLIYLLDFGAVKTAASISLPGKSTGIYSLGFAPPEQMGGNRVYPSTDLYALAVTCIQLLTGQDPELLFDSYNNIWNWHKFAPHISEQLTKVLDRMLLSAPNQRFQTATEVLMALGFDVSQLLVNSAIPLSSSLPLISEKLQHKFTLVDLLSSSAFTGFVGNILFKTLELMLPNHPSLYVGIWGATIGGLLFAQWRGFIAKFDFLFIGLVATILCFIFAISQDVQPVDFLLKFIITSIFWTAVLIAITTIFRLIYNLITTNNK